MAHLGRVRMLRTHPCYGMGAAAEVKTSMAPAKSLTSALAAGEESDEPAHCLVQDGASHKEPASDLSSFFNDHQH